MSNTITTQTTHTFESETLGEDKLYAKPSGESYVYMEVTESAGNASILLENKDALALAKFILVNVKETE